MSLKRDEYWMVEDRPTGILLYGEKIAKEKYAVEEAMSSYNESTYKIVKVKIVKVEK